MESKTLEASRFIASNSKGTTKTQQRTETTTTITGLSGFLLAISICGFKW